MAEGSNAFNGLAVPLNGNFEITSESASLDIMTLTQAASGTGDFIVAQSQNGTEAFVVEDAGKVVIGGEGLTVTSGGITVTAGDVTVSAGDVVVGDGYYLRFSSADVTTAPASGMTNGDLFVYQAANTYRVAVCVGNQALWYKDLA